MRRWRHWVLGVGFLFLASCGDENQFVPPPPPTVTVAQPHVQEVTTFDEFVGRADAVETIEIRARVKGFLDTIDFEPSDMVDEDAVLFTIEHEPFQAAVDAADAELAVAIANRDLQSATFERTKSSFEQGAANEIEMLEATANRDAAAAAVRVAEAALETAKIDLGYTTITSPVRGRVSRDLVNIGNLVGSDGSTLLTTVVVIDPIHVYFNIDERTLLKYLAAYPGEQRGSTRQLPISFELLDGRVYDQTGTIDFADNRVDPTTGTIEIRAVVSNPDIQLFPGMFLRARIPADSSESMLVPETSLQRDLTGPYLLVAGDGDVVERRDVVLGAKTGRQRVVLEGLSPDDRVIINGLQRARPGLEVTAEDGSFDIDPEAVAGGATADPAPDEGEAPEEDGGAPGDETTGEGG